MAEPKTQRTKASVKSFIDSIADEQVREDCHAIAEIMQKATQAKPAMWGTSIVGFGSYRLEYASGRQADWPLIGFSPRKRNIVLYIMPDSAQREELMARLGKHKTGKVCLYIERLSDVHVPTLEKLVTASVRHILETHPRE